jgi:hypothetical protein
MIYLDSPDDRGRELSTSEALSAALTFFKGFDQRVTNQRVLDHAPKSAKAEPVALRNSAGESVREGVQK